MTEHSPSAACPGADRDCTPDTGRSGPGLAGELRDTELAITLWHQKASEFGGLPPLTAFDFSRMICGAWCYRFVISVDAVAGEPTFLIYGSKFAQLLGLAQKPISGVPITRQLPGRYLPLTDGCSHAIAQAAPVRLSGAVVDYGQIELYRAAFMPLAMRPNSSMQAVFGTFNRRIGPKAYSSEAVRTTYNSLYGNVKS
jgi:hypothetical protein